MTTWVTIPSGELCVGHDGRLEPTAAREVAMRLMSGVLVSTGNSRTT